MSDRLRAASVVLVLAGTVAACGGGHGGSTTAGPQLAAAPTPAAAPAAPAAPAARPAAAPLAPWLAGHRIVAMRLAGRPIPLARSANGRGRLRPWVALDADGYAYGDTGCMAFTGTWQRRGGALRVAIGESLGEADCGGDARRDAVSSAWLGTLAHGLIVRRSGSVDAGRIGVLVRPQAVRHPRRSGTFVGMRFDRVLALPSGPAWRVGRQEGSWPADLDGSGIGLPDCGGYDLVVVDGYVVEDAAVACPDIGVSPDLLA